MRAIRQAVTTLIRGTVRAQGLDHATDETAAATKKAEDALRRETIRFQAIDVHALTGATNGDE